ncbi:MAG: 7-cyano-7-deazaguanine synthase, partial [Promethearchaeota archaeon]
AVNAPEGYIPLRNLIFYSIAAYFAEALACKYIIGGHISTDSKIFSDANESFFKSIEKVVNQSKHSKDNKFTKFIFPLITMDKRDVIQLANKLNVPIELTWSCYHDFDKPCGNCLSCINREKALNQNNYNHNGKPEKKLK